MLKIYNTLSRKKEIFKPIQPNKVGIYICGVTVYDYCHIGHARTYISVDVIMRYLAWRGFEINYVRNITDIDDKIIKRANENGENIHQITKRFIQAMHEDFAALNLLPPNHEPRATEFIPQMIALITMIVKNGHGYVGENGDVYFDVRSFKEYGFLSQHKLHQLESGARVEISEVKRDPLDFVLWKLAKPNEPQWDSPWGRGRPGWHIECSAMAMDLLGEHFDIHGGGRDLIFPHHENEIAQAKAGTNKKFANMWIHGGFLQIEKEKMSKSTGNFITIRDLLQVQEPEVLRYLLLSSQYRSPLLYSADLLQQAKQSLTRLYNSLRLFSKEIKKNKQLTESNDFKKRFIAAMDDDFNTPIALSVLFDLAHEVQRLRETNKESAQEHASLLFELGNVLGILQSDPEVFLKSGVAIDTNTIEQLIAARNKARKEKNWAEADRIRNKLTEMAISIEDTASGTTWKSIK